MADVFTQDGNALLCRFNGETLRIEPWGADALRVRARPGQTLAEPHVDALLPVDSQSADVTINSEKASITRGRIRAEFWIKVRYGADVRRELMLRFVRSDTGEELLSETRSHFAGPKPRNFKAIASGSWKLEQQFKAYDGEKLWGLGQPQHGKMDLKGVSTTLLQQNAHVVIPFVVSSRGYGFLWNNPAVGRAEFASNITRWTAEATNGLDYWITAGTRPKRLCAATSPPPANRPTFPTGRWDFGSANCVTAHRMNFCRSPASTRRAACRCPAL